MARHTKYISAILPVLVLPLSGPGQNAYAQAGWKTGAAKVNITPDKYMWMSGYGGRDRPAEGKLCDLWAKALAMEDGSGNRGVLISIDLIGIDRELSLSVCRELRRRYGLERRQIALCFSHTHTGPVVGHNLAPLHYLVIDKEQQQLVDAYAGKLQEKLITVVGQAVERLAPSSLSWGSGIATYAVNRRNNREPEVPRLREEGKLKGPYDHDVPVLAVSNEQGQLTALVFGYACHSTVLSFYRWSGDHPGFAQMALEEDHPGCTALFWAGCGADQNPLPRRSVARAMMYGARLANAVNETLAEDMKPVVGELNTSYCEVDLPLEEPPTREQLEEQAASSDRFLASRAKMLLASLDEGKPLPRTYPYPISLWQIGEDVQFVTLGGEVVVDFAVRLKSELRGVKTWVAGYSNDVMAYIASRRVLKEGGYEGGGAMVYYGLPAAWAPESEDMIVNAVHALLKNR